MLAIKKDNAMHADFNKRLINKIIFGCYATSTCCLIALIAAAIIHAPQPVIKFWAYGFIGGFVFALCFMGLRIILSANDTFEIAAAASGSMTMAHIARGAQVVSVLVLLGHFFSFFRVPAFVFYGAILTIIGVGMWVRFQGERALAIALAQPVDEGGAGGLGAVMPTRNGNGVNTKSQEKARAQISVKPTPPNNTKEFGRRRT